MHNQSAAVLAAKAQYGLTDREIEYINLVLRPNEPSVHEIAEHMGRGANTEVARVT
ncbi:MAG: hypothetical protein IPJ76_13395 [Flavobacteriales bacterium]|nr:MAG: hypothetical protein IPJ76_13395 [Flavobacteriales bacterium]